MEIAVIRDDYSFETFGFGLTCLQCGDGFVAKRRDAKFCSALCRKASSRRREQIERAANYALREIETIRRLVAEFPDLEITGAIQLQRVAVALSVTTARRTHDATDTSVTLAAGTDIRHKTCEECRELKLCSPVGGLCIDCIRDAQR